MAFIKKHPFCTGCIFCVVLFLAWGYGFAYGKEYWGKRYDWIIEDLHKDIDGCRSVLNDKHHCVSICAEEFEKLGC